MMQKMKPVICQSVCRAPPLFRSGRRAAFSLVELLVVIATIGILLGLLLPAIQVAREAARRSRCSSNLHQLGIAILKYEGKNGYFPPGAHMLTRPRDPSISWRVMILGDLEESGLYEQTQPLPSGGAANWDAQYQALNVFLCDSAPRPPQGPTTLKESHYSGIAGPGRNNKRVSLEQVRCGDIATDGAFFPQSRTRIAQITDGTSKTLAIGERTYNFFDWVSGAIWEGTPPTRICSRAANNVRYPINADLNDPAIGYYVGDSDAPIWATKKMLVNDLLFGSYHPGGAQFCFADGSVQMLADTIEFTLFEDLATVASGEVIQMDW
jgi:prepilin-type processing-associated H-X9-DG protein